MNRILLLAACLVASWHDPCRAQPTPPLTPTLTIVVPIERNGIIDAVTRPLAERMAREQGRPVLVENRPGALTNTGSADVAHAPGDGRLLLANSRQMVNNIFLSRSLTFDAVRDLAPVSLVATTAFVLAVTPDLPVKNVGELVAMARARPGALSYANSGKASNQQMSVELLKSLSGTDITRREYDGGGGAMDAVAAGRSDLGFFAQVAALPMIRSGRLRALAVTSTTRSHVLPDVPTVAESGLPGYEFTSWVGIFAPSSTPAALLDQLNADVAAAARSDGFVGLMHSQGGEAVGSSRSEFAAFIGSEVSLWGGLITRSGIPHD